MKDGGEQSPPFSFLAVGTDAEEFQPVRHGAKAVLPRDAPLYFRRKTFPDLHHLRALRADQMVVMAFVSFVNEFKPRGTVAEIKTLYHSQFF